MGNDPPANSAHSGPTGRSAIVIAGGGIGGLSAALALAKHDIASIVLERRAVYAEEGAGIQLGPNGTALLKSLGAGKHLQPYVGVPETIEVHDGGTGDRLARLPLGDWIARRHGAPYWVAHRQDLHQALLAAAAECPAIRLVLDAEIRSVDRTKDAVRVHTRDGRTWEGRGLVGADGIWSTVRRLFLSDEAPVSTGISAVRATIPVEDLDCDRFCRSTIVWMRPDSHLVHYPVRAGAEFAVVCILNSSSADTDWSSVVDADWVMKQVAPFPSGARTLLQRAERWRRWSLFRLERPFAFSSGNVAVLGDAAHPVLPFLAQGAVMAIEDAVTLADCVAGGRDIDSGFAAYASGRRERVTKVAAASRRNGRIYHLGGLPAVARNAALRLIAGEQVMAGYDWLYGWKPASA